MSILKYMSQKILNQKARFYRKISQYFFLTVVLLMGIQFTIFINHLEQGIMPSVSRPPGIEAFLPISALMSLKYWIVSGVFSRIHPSGLIIFITIIASALILKRGFCSWVCPIGLLSEYLEKIHRLIFKKNIKLPRWIDYPLRSLKYLLLLFFLWSIMIKMNGPALELFINSPYNKIADIKMLKFFTDISSTALITIAVLIGLSILFRNFWCRYLCPYGALLGILSFFSIFKIHRNEQTCTSCKRCTRVCPSDIQIHKNGCVITDECHACLKCVDACPEKDTLYLSLFSKKGIIKPLVYLTAIFFLFSIGPTLGRVVGLWQNDITPKEYMFHLSSQNRSLYKHNRGTVPDYDKEMWRKKMQQFMREHMEKERLRIK